MTTHEKRLALDKTLETIAKIEAHQEAPDIIEPSADERTQGYFVREFKRNRNAQE